MADVGKIAAVITANAAPFEAGMAKAAAAANTGAGKINAALSKIDPGKAFGNSLANKFEDIFKVGGVIGAVTGFVGMANSAMETTAKEAKSLADSIGKIDEAFRSAAKAAKEFDDARTAVLFSLDSGDAAGRIGAAGKAGVSATAAAQAAVKVARDELSKFDQGIADRGLLDDAVNAGRRGLGRDGDAADRARLVSRLKAAALEASHASADADRFAGKGMSSVAFDIRGQASLLQGMDPDKDLSKLEQLRKSLRDTAETLGEIGSNQVSTLDKELESAIDNAKEQSRIAERNKLIDQDIAESAKKRAEEAERALAWETAISDEHERQSEEFEKQQQAAAKRSAELDDLADKQGAAAKAEMLAAQQDRFDRTKEGGAAGIVTRGSAEAASAMGRFERMGAAMPQRQKELDALKRIENASKDTVLAVKALDLAANFTVVRF